MKITEEMARNETWRDIPGFNSKYQVSAWGRVRRHNGKIVKQFNIHGYCAVHLDGKNYRVHRLVATVFLPNPNNYPIVNHKNERRDCNCVGNLEWCTYQYNNTYGTKIRRMIQTRTDSPGYSGVECVDTGDVFISISDAAMSFGMCHKTLAAAFHNSESAGLDYCVCGGYLWQKL